MWYLCKHFLYSANISLLFHKNENITRTVPLLKSNSTYFLIYSFFSMMDIKDFTTEGVRSDAVGGGKCFFDRVTILFHQCNNTKYYISAVSFLFTFIFYS